MSKPDKPITRVEFYLNAIDEKLAEGGSGASLPEGGEYGQALVRGMNNTSFWATPGITMDMTQYYYNSENPSNNANAYFLAFFQEWSQAAIAAGGAFTAKMNYSDIPGWSYTRGVSQSGFGLVGDLYLCALHGLPAYALFDVGTAHYSCPATPIFGTYDAESDAFSIIGFTAHLNGVYNAETAICFDAVLNVMRNEGHTVTTITGNAAAPTPSSD